MEYKYLFGPVPSRRLGLSLGVDLVPLKTCSLDCIYCECGRTTELIIDRKEYVPTEEVIKELDHYLKKTPELDYITFSGSGEPTLHNKIGEIVSFLKSNYPDIKIALLTNSTLLHNRSLQNEIINIDLLLPSLDAVSEDIFKKINRPSVDITVIKMIDGLIEFRKKFKGLIWIEMFIIQGINDSDKEIELFKETLTNIKPDKIQLNSLDRPGTESWVSKSSEDNLIKIKDLLSPLPVEIIAKYQKGTRPLFEQENIEKKILSILYRRPCTIEDIQKITGLKAVEINKYIQILIATRAIFVDEQERGLFYKIKEKKDS